MNRCSDVLRSRRRAAIGLVAIGLAWLATAAEPEHSRVARPADPPAATEPPPESLEVRYARAALELARLDVERFDAANRKVPATFAEATIEPLRRIVTLCEGQLEAALAAPGAPRPRPEVRLAESRLRAVEADQTRAAAMNREQPGMVAPLDEKRLAATVRVARIALEKARAEPDPPGLEQLHERIVELEMDVLRLRSRLDQTPTSGGAPRWWPYGWR